MGLLYGAKLSVYSDVILVGNNEENINLINKNGITVKRDGERHYTVPTITGGTYKEKVDLIIIFTKAYVTREALEVNKNLIGEDTVVMTLQNGAGHEDVLREYVDESRIIIGTTTIGSYRENPYTVVNTGLGDTTIGPVCDDKWLENKLKEIAEIFEDSGFPCVVTKDIKQTIWNKLMINASSSVLSGIMGQPQGAVVENDSAWELCCDLIKEMCETANAIGCKFDYEQQKDRMYKHLNAAPDGMTSICVDLKNKRKTEVDYINGAVVRAAQKIGKRVCTHETIVKIVHMMEG